MGSRLMDCRFLHGSETPLCSAVVDKRFIGYCTLQFIVRGRISLSYNARSYELEGRWVFPACPGPLIRFRPAPGSTHWHHRYVAVTGPLVDQWRVDGLWPDAPEMIDDSLPLESRFDEMLALFQGGFQQRGANALEAILLLLAEFRARPSGPPWLAQARELLASPPGFRTGIAGLARDHGMAPAAFRRAFKAATGLSPRDWSIHARMERARELLAGTRITIGEIAQRLGYGDSQFFSRQFARHTGLPPLQWRRSRI